MAYCSLCPFVTTIVKFESPEVANVTPTSKCKNSTFYTQSIYIYIYFTYLRRDTNFTPYKTKWSVPVTELESVFYAVRNGS